MLDANTFDSAYTRRCAMSRKHRFSCVAYAKVSQSLSRVRNGLCRIGQTQLGFSHETDVARSLPLCPLHSSTIRSKGASECAKIMYGRSFWLAVKAREFVVFSSSFVVEPD